MFWARSGPPPRPFPEMGEGGSRLCNGKERASEKQFLLPSLHTGDYPELFFASTNLARRLQRQYDEAMSFSDSASGEAMARDLGERIDGPAAAKRILSS